MELLETDFENLQRSLNDRRGPIFDEMRGFLYWPDERPSEVSSSAYTLAIDLCIYRNINFHLDTHSLKSVILLNWISELEGEMSYFKEKWSWALKNVPLWPGFSRLEISVENKELLERKLEQLVCEGYDT